MSNHDDEEELTSEENKLEASSTNQDNIDSNNPKIIQFGEQKERNIKFNFEILFEKLKLVLSLERNCRKNTLSTVTCENFLATFNELGVSLFPRGCDKPKTRFSKTFFHFFSGFDLEG